MKRIPAVDTFGDLCERLMIIINRMAWLEQQKRDLYGSEPEVIAKLDLASRDACEGRSAIKNRINQVCEELARGQYQSIQESRSFRPPDDRFADVLERHCEEIAHYFVSEELSDALVEELLGEEDAHPARRADDSTPILGQQATD